MDVLWCLLLALLLLHRAACASDQVEMVGAVGRSITFFLQSMDTSTAWSFHSEVIVTVKFGNPPEVTFFDDNYKSRLAFPENGSALTISQLRLDDAGTYTAKRNTAKTSFALRVYRELAVPTVTCVAQNCSANGCRYTLRCTASGSGSGNVSYGWSVGVSPLSEGPTVLVEESALEELPLTCVARNPVSSRNATVISPAALCTENTTRPPTTGAYSGSQAGIVAACVAGAVVLVAALVFLIYCKCKGWSVFRLPAAEAMSTEPGAEYMTVYAQVGPYQQSFSSAELHSPKKMLSTNEETSQTVYSTIQATAQTDDEKMGKGAPGCQEQAEETVYSSVGKPECLEEPRHGSAAPMNLL
ncbi:SLAM family member 7-like isoform X1 [Chroicocephalus ridibundus]|uniref:SLAM family member 7-like isoform X1 n=1 Tax=Chroicocephalus ridibundus TaxID=1192867 RepID=UPI002FDE1DDD